MDTRVIAI